MAPELVSKSANQRSHWRAIKQAAVDNFIALCTDKYVNEITRDDAFKCHTFWNEKIAPAKGKPTHSVNTGNRDIGNLRKILAEWHRYDGLTDVRNAFDGLSFAGKIKRSCPPFPVHWILEHILAQGKLTCLNDKARAIVLVMIETGARPSEICNLVGDGIVLDAEIPHILISPRRDSDDPREIKTESSIRAVPLVGVAVAAMRKHPHGFPRYADKGGSLSVALGKFFRENGPFPTSGHKIYSLRHSSGTA
ncbi:MAG: hypothetical protein WC048_17150 [Rhizobium sp.]